MVNLMSEMLQIPEIIDGLPNISGWEKDIIAVANHHQPVFLSNTNLRLENLKSTFAIALHFHQPTIPAGHNGELISNLQQMFNSNSDEQKYNAGIFAWCYSRIGDFIPELVNNGCNPRIMLDYSGNLLWGLQQMGRNDIINNLKRITCDRTYQPYVEWLGTMWSHGVVSSTPIPDIKLHILAWQHHFAAIFGWDALARVKGFSPPEMHLPNHPDTLYAYIKALKECGYRWLLVQEHSIETLAGKSISYKHLPHRLIARNSQGEVTSITALIKTQGSDTKLVAQMQPYYEAKGLSWQKVGEMCVPPIVTQIGDGENGGVMMNEFPDGFKNAYYDMRNNSSNNKSGIVGINGTEYLEIIENAGFNPENYPPCQPTNQHKIWEKISTVTPEAVAKAIEELKEKDHNFHIEGASWTNNISWVQGYENILEPIHLLSALFHKKIDHLLLSSEGSITKENRYRQALLYNLLLQTSCFRYWGQGMWTDYAEVIYESGKNYLKNSFCE